MPQSKTITLQELANIIHQYSVVSVHIYSPDGTSGAALRFGTGSCSLYRSGDNVKAILLANDSCSFRIEGPTVTVQYDTPPAPSYATFFVTAHDFTFSLTLC